MSLLLEDSLTQCRLHRYLTDTLHVDIFWYIGSRLDQGPSSLPPLDAPVSGASIVPWRYHFNTGKELPNLEFLLRNLRFTDCYSHLLIYISMVDVGRLGVRTRLARTPRRESTSRMGWPREDLNRSLPRIGTYRR